MPLKITLGGSKLLRINALPRSIFSYKRAKRGLPIKGRCLKQDGKKRSSQYKYAALDLKSESLLLALYNSLHFSSTSTLFLFF